MKPLRLDKRDPKRVADKYCKEDGSEPDTGPADGEQVQISQADAEAIYRLMSSLSPAEYGRRRERWAEDLTVPLAFLDAEYKERRQGKSTAKAEGEPEPRDMAVIAESAAKINSSTDVLDLFVKDLGKVVTGEQQNAKLIYLNSTTRLFSKCNHTAVKGPSSGGKSELRKHVLEFFPPESVIAFTTLSEKALIYEPRDFKHKILSMGEAVATDEQNFQDYLLRELMSEGRIRHQAPQKIGNDIVTVTIEKEGPVAFVVTTTKTKLHVENETRMISLEVDDSDQQTARVLVKVAQVDGLNDAGTRVDYEPWRDFQRWLENGERRVVIPYAGTLARMIPAKAVRLRRDFSQVLRAIKAHALLHRGHRERDDEGQIVADIELDYRVVLVLMNDLLAEGAGVAVNPQMQQTIDAVAKVTAAMASDHGATALEVAKVLKLDKAPAWRRLKAAVGEGYINNLEVRRGQPGRYRVSGQKVEAAVLLPEVSDLTAAHADTPTPPRGGSKTGATAQPVTYPSEVIDENGCAGVRNRHATGQPKDATGSPEEDARNPDATGRATVNPMNDNENSPPVARLRGFSGGGGEGVGICAHCGQPGDLMPTSFSGSRTVHLHRHCFNPYQDAGLELPPFLDRRLQPKGECS